jgi:hypothetical protein
VARIPLARLGSWQFDPDPAHASEIKVRFTADGPDETAVQLEHRHVERVVDGQALRDGITGGGGWSALLELFAEAATIRPDPATVLSHSSDPLAVPGSGTSAQARVTV